ncbi:type II toxin-antitoxin system RelE/ParE family toxin [Limnoraphis robusta Tam1]|uniref:type II toxin-antitoxin system RelE/ParE family toxin n=1 Tax=Limnoraphis robusta TaxID=1118279 RepID=UPI002B208B25|nr:type II toxin-antitoxin system RelE/ParE family toxin [Limnoraphis robusta]MEA5497459.1 type II toxin-antitoxin system RelE/ParE family toxin [Limnoraphis robusta BA-68 BA1]MEA5540560.1 type II toxin-antitoxin system RelE/ParE family toxin [Limnoraphis robusta Tam1]
MLTLTPQTLTAISRRAKVELRTLKTEYTARFGVITLPALVRMLNLYEWSPYMAERFKIQSELIEDWLTKEVDQRYQAIILKVLETFEEFGPLSAREKLPNTKIKFLRDGIWEIRVGQYRIAYFWNNSTCYLLRGIQKKRNDWPKRYMKIIRKRKSIFIQQKTYLK